MRLALFSATPHPLRMLHAGGGGALGGGPPEWPFARGHPKARHSPLSRHRLSLMQTWLRSPGPGGAPRLRMAPHGIQALPTTSAIMQSPRAQGGLAELGCHVPA